MNKYNIPYEEEHQFWINKVWKGWIQPNNKCPACNNISLNLKKIKSIANPYKLQCNKSNCRKIVNIRNNTIFPFFPNTPMSTLIQSIEALICECKNAANTIEYINEKYKLSTAGQKIYIQIF